MKSILASLIFFAFSSISMAEVYQSQLGQNLSLQSGDVAIVSYGSYSSVINCNGAPAPQPTRKNYESTESVFFNDTLQSYGQQLLSIYCKADSYESSVRQAQASALYNARQRCFADGFKYCSQPLMESEKFFVQLIGRNPGEFSCQVTARIIGTQSRPF